MHSRLPGLFVPVVHEGRVTCMRPAGVTSVIEGRSTISDTAYLWFSMTKIATATAAGPTRRERSARFGRHRLGLRAGVPKLQARPTSDRSPPAQTTQPAWPTQSPSAGFTQRASRNPTPTHSPPICCDANARSPGSLERAPPTRTWATSSWGRSSRQRQASAMSTMSVTRSSGRCRAAPRVLGHKAVVPSKDGRYRSRRGAVVRPPRD